MTPRMNTAQLAIMVRLRPKRAETREIERAARKAPMFWIETITALTVVLSV